MLTADNTRGTCNLTAVSLNNKNYELHDMNIHFGCDSSRGSEHTVDGKSFPAEVSPIADTRSSFQSSVESNSLLAWFCYTSPCDW